MEEDFSLRLPSLRSGPLEEEGSAVLQQGPHHAAALAHEESAARLSAEERSLAEQFLAILEAAVLVAAANGDLAEAEIVRLLHLFRELSGGALSEDHAELWLDRFLSALTREGLETRLAKNAGTLQDPALRRTAFSFAVGLAYSDGEVDEAEVSVFTALAEHYQIPIEEAQQLLEQVEDELLGPESAQDELPPEEEAP
jgi:uncharacterized tellurite resistance protein B-like protein